MKKHTPNTLLSLRLSIAVVFFLTVFLESRMTSAQAPTGPENIPPKPVGKPNEASMVDPLLETSRGILEGIIEDFKYDASGRRDPFLPFTAPRPLSQEEADEIVSPLQRYDLDQLKLIGIIWDVSTPKALFLDPNGKSYVVGKLEKIGRQRGYIAEIREGEVIVLEKYVGEDRSTFQTRSLKLPRD